MELSCDVIQDNASVNDHMFNCLAFKVTSNGEAVPGIDLVFSCNGNACLSQTSSTTNLFGICHVIIRNVVPEDISVKAEIRFADIFDFQYGIVSFRE